MKTSDKQNLVEESAFEVPEHYFSAQFEKLKHIPYEKHGMKVPLDFFENQEAKILSKIKQEKKSKLKFIYWLIPPAVAALFIFILNPNLKTPSTAKINLDKVSDNEIIEHLSHQELNEDLLCETGWCQDIHELNKPNDLEKYLIETENLSNLIDHI
jgi:hypothetical protein